MILKIKFSFLLLLLWHFNTQFAVFVFSNLLFYLFKYMPYQKFRLWHNNVSIYKLNDVVQTLKILNLTGVLYSDVSWLIKVFWSYQNFSIFFCQFCNLKHQIRDWEVAINKTSNTDWQLVLNTDSLWFFSWRRLTKQSTRIRCSTWTE